MAESDIQIRNTQIIFLDGTVSFALLRYDMIAGDPPKIRMYMALSPYMIRYTKVQKEELKFIEGAMMVGEGYVSRDYLASFKTTISDNPEFPLILMACNFNGDPVNVNSPNMQIVIDLINSINTRDAIIASLRKNIKTLEDELDRMFQTRGRKETTSMNELKDLILSMNRDKIQVKQ